MGKPEKKKSLAEKQCTLRLGDRQTGSQKCLAGTDAEKRQNDSAKGANQPRGEKEKGEQQSPPMAGGKDREGLAAEF